MMAVAALSLAVQDGKERLDALQHYQQALPALQSSLKSTEDLSSDGAFLTHFLLLVYEVSEISQSDSVLAHVVSDRSSRSRTFEFVAATPLNALANFSTETRSLWWRAIPICCLVDLQY